MYDNLDLYCKKIENNNMIYSIDKLRLKTYITFEQFSKLEFLLKTVYKDLVKRFWISERPMCYKYNYNIEIEEGKSFFLDFMHNSERIKFDDMNKKFSLVLEFNPNKLKNDKLIKYILCSYPNWLLKSLDLAVDIPINILDLLVDIGGKRKLLTISLGGDNKTYTYGKNDGRVKIYNKKNESKLNIVGNLTRIEVSREFEDFPIMKVKEFNFGKDYFPSVYLNQYVFSFLEEKTKDKTLMALLYAVQNGYPLKELSRVYREKIKNLLQGGSLIKFDVKSANQVFFDVIYYYFLDKKSKQIFF